MKTKGWIFTLTFYHKQWNTWNSWGSKYSFHVLRDHWTTTWHCSDTYQQGFRMLDSPDQAVHCRRSKNVGYTLRWTMCLCCSNSQNWSLTGNFRKNASVWTPPHPSTIQCFDIWSSGFIQNYLKCLWAVSISQYSSQITLYFPLSVPSKQKSTKTRISHTALKYFKP